MGKGAPAPPTAQRGNVAESGGHGARRGRSTLPFVPAVVDLAAPTPVLAAGGERVLVGDREHDAVAEVLDLLEPHLEVVERSDPVFEEAPYRREAFVGAEPPGRHVEDRLRPVEAHHPVVVAAVGRFEGAARLLEGRGGGGLTRHGMTLVFRSFVIAGFDPAIYPSIQGMMDRD